jgi:hemerythrin
MIIWNEQLKTGSDTIDQQHQMLIHNINHLECLLTETSPTRETCDFLIQLVNFLESYTEMHFRFEEGCMEKHRCPVHAKNKQAHEEFMAFFREFKEHTRRKGLRPEVVRTLHQTISQWIEEHIMQVDIQLKPCLKGSNP